MATANYSNKLILNYNDAILYASDVSLLHSETAWLNDACMHFYLTVLQDRRPDLSFMDPSVITFLMHQCDDEDLEDFAAGVDKTRSAYLIPVNDGHASSAAWRQPGGGSHWSLLCIHGEAYQHFDSVTGHNAVAARAVANRFSRILGHASFLVEEIKTPQQHNGYDCGLHALGAAEILSSSTSVPETKNTLLVQPLGKPGFGLEMRKKVLKKVMDLEKEYAASR